MSALLGTLFAGENNTPSPGVWFNFRTGEIEGLGDERVTRWQGAFPSIDVPEAIELAECYIVSNPRRFRDDYIRFLEKRLRRLDRRAAATARASAVGTIALAANAAATAEALTQGAIARATRRPASRS
jgi:hypothetical protein